MNLLNEIKEGKGKAAIHILAARGNLEIIDYVIQQGV